MPIYRAIRPQLHKREQREFINPKKKIENQIHSLFLTAALFFVSAVEIRADIKDKGDFKVGFARQKGQKTKRLDGGMQKSLQGLGDELNGTFALPGDFYLTTDECGEPNAFYEKPLSICV